VQPVRQGQAGGTPAACKRRGGPVAHKTGRSICKDCRVDDRAREYRRATALKSLYGITVGT